MSDSSIKQNKELVLTFMQRFSEGKLDAAFDLLSEDLHWSFWGNGPAAGVFTKAEMLDGLRQRLAYFRQALQWIPVAVTAEEDRVAVEARSYGVTHGGFEYRNHYHSLLRVRAGQICEIKEMFEESTALALFAALEAEGQLAA